MTPIVFAFHDGPDKPAAFDVFDQFLPVLDTTGRKPFKDLVAGFPFDLVVSVRGTFATFSTTALTPRFLEAVKDEAAVRCSPGLRHGVSMSTDIRVSGHRQSRTPAQRQPGQL